MTAETELRTRFLAEAVPLSSDLLRVARRLTRSRLDAEDLVQDTMLKGYAGFASYKQGSNLRAWLMRIMHNTWVSKYRMVKRRPVEVSFADVADPTFDRFAEPSNPVESEVLLAIPDQRIVWALRQLSSEIRKTVCYADIDGYRYREIADIMQVPSGTVMSRLHRGRRRLCALLGPVAEEHGYSPKTYQPSPEGAGMPTVRIANDGTSRRRIHG